MDMDLSNLNLPQREAVECTEGPLLILAGAGSGKTRVLTTRIAYLIREKDVAPWQILAITFTNKAARELRERIVDLVGPAGEKVWACTFHAACVRILRGEIHNLGYDRNFVIYDEADQQTLLKHILKEQNLDEKRFPARGVAARISAWKNELRTPENAFFAAEGDLAEERYADLYRIYQERLRQNDALDFDDIIMLTVQLFTEHPGVLARYQDRFRYILVDEYQDTNMAQYTLVQLLARAHENLCVVGDDDQSIYQWRGADVRNILSFQQDYPHARVIKLEENYRSSQTILDAAYSVIRNNTARTEKRLWTEKKGGNRLACYVAADAQDEAGFIAQQVRAEVAAGRHYRDFAVLCRATAQFRVLEETFIKEALPYCVFGGQKFYGRKEIKDILAYLRLMENPNDRVSAERALSAPRRGVGEASWSKLVQFAETKGISVSEALVRAEACGAGKKYAGILARFGRQLESFRELSKTLPVTELTRTILEETGYLQELEMEHTVEAQTRLDNLQEFLSITTAFDAREEDEDHSLQAFLAEVALYTDLDQMDGGEDSVSILTMHAAKGLEFPVVFITGLEEGVFPNSRALYGDDLRDGVEEERRLMYVALTRAKEQVYLTLARERMLYGRTNYNVPSRFLREIPRNMLLELRPRASARHGGGAGRAYRERPLSEGIPVLSTPGKPSGQDSAAPAAGGEYALNDAIEHKKWGRGVVVGVSGSGEELSLRVIFPDVGMKDLFVKYAPIRKVD